MKPVTLNKKIESIARQKNGYLATEDLSQKRIPRKYLSLMVNEGSLERIGRGMYRLTDIDYSEYESYLEVTRKNPKAVICLLSALVYHGLSTINPGEVYIAVPNKIKAKLLLYTPVKVHYLAPLQYESGIEQVSIRGEKVNIYNKEKTVCQMVQFRNKYGADLALEAIKNYVKSHPNYPKLMQYARECRVEKRMSRYLEVLA